MITETQAFIIRELRALKVPVKEIANHFNVSVGAIEGVIYNKTWNGIPANHSYDGNDGRCKRKAKCTRCGVLKMPMTIPKGHPKNKYNHRTNTILHWLVDGEWTYHNPKCKPKQIAFTAI